VATGVLAALVGGTLVQSTLRRGDPAFTVTNAVNSEAERRAAGYLVDHPAPGGELMTASYNLAGVLDALGHESLHPLQAHALLQACTRRPDGGTAACVGERLRWILAHDGVLPLRVLAQTQVTPVDSPMDVQRAVPDALRGAASSLGLEASVETSFATAGGVEALRLYRVERPVGH
jgi:hypothetical protein